MFADQTTSNIVGDQTFYIDWFDWFDLQSPQLVEHLCLARMIWDLNKVIIIIIITTIIIIIIIITIETGNNNI